MEVVCVGVLDVAANCCRSQGKSTVAPRHVLDGIGGSDELRSVFHTDSVVMNALLLPVKDKAGRTALHAAATGATGGHAECVAVLVGCGADVNLAGPDRKTALHLAAEHGRADCVKLLLAAGAKVDATDKRKRTPLLLAVRAGRAVEASLLLHARASPDAADDSQNLSLIHI